MWKRLQCQTSNVYHKPLWSGSQPFVCSWYTETFHNSHRYCNGLMRDILVKSPFRIKWPMAFSGYGAARIWPYIRLGARGDLATVYVRSAMLYSWHSIWFLFYSDIVHDGQYDLLCEFIVENSYLEADTYLCTNLNIYISSILVNFWKINNFFFSHEIKTTTQILLRTHYVMYCTWMSIYLFSLHNRCMLGLQQLSVL